MLTFTFLSIIMVLVTWYIVTPKKLDDGLVRFITRSIKKSNMTDVDKMMMLKQLHRMENTGCHEFTENQLCWMATLIVEANGTTKNEFTKRGLTIGEPI